MEDSPHHPTVSYRSQHTVGGLLVYASAGPAAVAVLSVPRLSLAFAAGVLAALLFNRFRASGRPSTGADADTEAAGSA